MPRSATVRGGLENGYDGVRPPTTGATNVLNALDRAGFGQTEEVDPFTGLGEILEADDKTAFKTVDDLVLRQVLLARNRNEQDKHHTYQKIGYTWSCLEKVQDVDQYRQSFPPGTESLRPSAVPNKQADLCHKLTETLMSDPPKPAPNAKRDSESAEMATEMAKEFLTQDGGENGTDDHAVFWAQIEGATTRACTFNHYWVDKTGGGSVPKQIRAHPQAQDPAMPLDAVGPDGQPIPTTDYVLRYVTEPDEQFPAGQFTDNPSEAARQWVPKIRIEKWGREHWRIFPEDKEVNQASCLVGLLYCTLGEAKRRWPETVGQMDDTKLGQLCDWTPNRYMVLLPQALRSRWKLQTGNGKDPKGGSNDERVLFYYVYYRLAAPHYPKGAALFTNGAFGGTTLEKDTLSAEVEMPSETEQDKTVTDVITMDIPVVPIRLIQDVDEKDPTGTAFMRRIGPSGEAGATLATAYLEAIDIILHPARFATATSPLTAEDVEESRALGDFASVLSKDDYPHYEEPRPLPAGFLNVMQWQYEQMDSAASLPKPVTGSDNQQEVSGVARDIAVKQALVSLGRMQQAVNSAWERHWRIKLQLAMKHFSVPQMMRYAGEDGAYKAEWWTGVNFAQVTDVDVKPGTGTLMTDQDKVAYASQLKQLGFLDQDTAADITRPAYAGVLGLPPDPQMQRIERQVASWLEGPPEGWVQEFQAYEQAMQLYQQQTAPIQAANQQNAQQHEMQTAAAQETGMAPGAPPEPIQLPPPPLAPWTPFAPLPMDTEPQIAGIRQRRLAKLMAQTKFTAQPPEWQQMVIQAYNEARNAVAQAMALMGPQAQGQSKFGQDTEKLKVQSGFSAKAPGAEKAKPPSSREPVAA